MYGFVGQGINQGNPFFEMTASYPGMDSIYSLIAGLCYLLPFGLGGMSLSLLKPGYNRGFLMTVLLICASCTSLT